MISSHEEMQRDKVKSELKCVELEEQQDMLQREGDSLKETIDSLKSTLGDFEARIGAALADKADVQARMEAVAAENDKMVGSAAIHDREMVDKSRIIKEQKIAIAELEKALDKETEDIGNSLTVLDTKEKLLIETRDKLEAALQDVTAKSLEVTR